MSLQSSVLGPLSVVNRLFSDGDHSLQWEGSQQCNIETLWFFTFSSVGIVENLLLIAEQNGKRNTRIR